MSDVSAASEVDQLVTEKVPAERCTGAGSVDEDFSRRRQACSVIWPVVRGAYRLRRPPGVADTGLLRNRSTGHVARPPHST